MLVYQSVSQDSKTPQLDSHHPTILPSFQWKPIWGSKLFHSKPDRFANEKKYTYNMYRDCTSICLYKYVYVSGFHFVLLKEAVSCFLFHTIFPIQDRGWHMQLVVQIICNSKATDATNIEHSQVEVAFKGVHVARHHQGQLCWGGAVGPVCCTIPYETSQLCLRIPFCATKGSGQLLSFSYHLSHPRQRLAYAAGGPNHLQFQGNWCHQHRA